ncbi:retrotransposon protein, putative, ty1-copia subclass [Tanacetum coccineum]
MYMLPAQLPQGMNQRPSYGRNRVTKLLGLFPAIEKWVEPNGVFVYLGRLCELKTTIDVGLFDRGNSMETIGKQYDQSSDVARHAPSLSDIMYMSYTPFCLTIADREVSAYKYKHFDAVKALRDNPDLMRSASGDALYGYWVGLNEEMKLNMQRIWKRNLARDDRYIADNDKSLFVVEEKEASWLCQLSRFREAKKLKQGALYLYVGNGVRAQVEAIESYDLVLPNGLVIYLDNCHYAPSITRGVISVHRLVENGFVLCFTDFGISVSKNNMFYFNVIPGNGIYEIDMHDLVPNVNSIYNVSTKRAKHNLDSTYLWHCRLAHISKKRIEKLQQEGLLKSTDDESFDQCVSCLSGKMTRKSFPHHPERATDLLGIIHTDVCGPLRHVSRQGASYFITFTDDYSRYGYVYLLKHKHEVFETFKVFKSEVENQLGKSIKALRSDRGGEYISQEFKDYLKACGIVQQLTPPYTPQYNGVSERRNHTLLDMVRSMMNLTTLLLSFWDYALESATHILNMVPTKKVDKTPYELWYGKVPNLSYLKVWGCEALVKWDTPDKLQQRSVKCIFIGYPKETMGYYFYFPPENKIVVARYAEFFEKNLITQEVSGRAVNLEEIQDEDTSPSKITSEIPIEVEGFEPPQEEVIPVCRSERTHRAPDHLCLNIEAEEHSIRNLNEPTSYKAAMLDSESNKWIDAMNVEI